MYGNIFLLVFPKLVQPFSWPTRLNSKHFFSLVCLRNKQWAGSVSDFPFAASWGRSGDKLWQAKGQKVITLRRQNFCIVPRSHGDSVQCIYPKVLIHRHIQTRAALNQNRTTSTAWTETEKPEIPPVHCANILYSRFKKKKKFRRELTFHKAVRSTVCTAHQDNDWMSDELWNEIPPLNLTSGLVDPPPPPPIFSEPTANGLARLHIFTGNNRLQAAWRGCFRR